MTVSSSTTDKPMSIDSSRSSSIGGNGPTNSRPTAMTAAGASRCVPRIGLATVVIGISKHQLFDADQIREHFGDGAEQRAGNRLADLALLVVGGSQRRILDDGHRMLASDVADAGGDQVASFRDNDRS